MSADSPTTRSTHGQPGNGQPTNGQPTNGQPTHGQPTNGQPTNGQSGNGQPTNGQSGNGQSGLSSVAGMSAQLGRYVWTQRRLFEIVGGWVQSTLDLNAKLMLGAHAPKHAWHASLFADLIPEIPGFTPSESIQPPNPKFVTFMDAMVETSSEPVERLVAIYRIVVPHLVVAYSAHLAVASSVSDAPVMRALRLALNDLTDDWLQGETGIQSLVSTPEGALGAARHQGSLDALLVASGGLRFEPRTS
jgi:hypothetical protein